MPKMIGFSTSFACSPNELAEVEALLEKHLPPSVRRLMTITYVVQIEAVGREEYIEQAESIVSQHMPHLRAQDSWLFRERRRNRVENERLFQMVQDLAGRLGEKYTVSFDALSDLSHNPYTIMVDDEIGRLQEQIQRLTEQRDAALAKLNPPCSGREEGAEEGMGG